MRSLILSQCRDLRVWQEKI